MFDESAVKLRPRLGDYLVEQGVISQSQLFEALNDQSVRGEKLGKTLVRLGWANEEEILDALSVSLGVEYLNLKKITIDESLAECLPERIARRLEVVLIDKTDEGFTAAFSDPSDLMTIDQIEKILRMPVIPLLSSSQEIADTIDRIYRQEGDIQNLAVTLSQSLGDDSKKDEVHDENIEEQEVPVAKLLTSIFEDAVKMHASDIHIEPGENLIRIRQRIDGILHEQILDGDARLFAALIQRLKLVSSLNITERRLPQDGRFQITVGSKKVDARLSTMPTQYGESIVMRLLDHSFTNDLSVSNLGMPENVFEHFNTSIHAPSGIILVVGPTGSGKTTSLYAALNEINTPEHKIITVEDPVEYQIPRINQVQVNPKIHLDFANVLRACLRQDPDVLMVGEVRDEETALIALRAALTGHLVFATMHTNDAPSAVFRLLNMGMPSYLVSASVRAVLSQRLVRLLCTNCAATYELTPRDRARIKTVVDEANISKIKKAVGCEYCKKNGYHGRQAVFELFHLNEKFIDQLSRDEFDQADAQASMKGCTMKDHAWTLVEQGLTSIEEVVRVFGEEAG